VKVPNPCLLRDRRLTSKPRIVRSYILRGFHVERMVPSNHPSVRAGAQYQHVDTFPEAIALAHKWAGPKETK
jgi:hypothetical protein